MLPDGKGLRRARKNQSLDDGAASSSLLRDLQALNMALSHPRLPAPAPEPCPKPAASLWKWRPLKALSHLGRRRFHCRFSLCVHSLRSLPPDLNGRPLCVRWRRAGSSASASAAGPVRVSRGAADFPGNLMLEDCHVYGQRGGPRGGPARYEPRQFVVSVATAGEAKPVAVAEHRLDLTSMLPESLEELEAGGCSRQWSTSFRLGGKAKGAVISVTFGFSLAGGGENPGTEAVVDEERRLRRTESLSVVERRASMGKDEDAPEEAMGVADCDGESCVTVDHVDEGVEVLSSSECYHPGSNGDGRMEMETETETTGNWEADGRNKDSKSIQEFDGQKKLEIGVVSLQHKSVEDPGVDREGGLADIESAIAISSYESGKPEFTVTEKGLEVLASQELVDAGVLGGLEADAPRSEFGVCYPEVNKEMEEEEVEEEEALVVGERDAIAGREIDDGSKLENHAASEMATEDLDSAFCQSSVLDLSMPVDMPRERLESSVLYGGEFSTLDMVLSDESPRETLEGSASHALPEAKEFLPLDSLESSGFHEMSMLGSSVASTDLPTVKLESTNSHGPSSLEVLEAVPSNSAAYRLPILESVELADPSQAKSDHSVYPGNSSLEMPTSSDSQGVMLDGLELSDHMEINPDHNSGRSSESPSFDDVTESIASEFLAMLGLEQSPPLASSSESDPESPREQLLKQFRKDDAWRQFESTSSSDLESPKERLWREFQNECSAIEGSILCPVAGSGIESDLEEDLDLSSIVQAAESEQEKLEQEVISKARAKLLEDAETEVLMREMGLNKKAFQHSPPGSRYGFGSPIEFPNRGPLEPPPLGDGLGPFIQTRDGGYLRSMSPLLFENAKNNGSLIMQVSNPVVVPAELGSGIMDILQGLASIGIEKLSMQAKKIMPLEDVTGKSMQQVAWEALPSLEANERMNSDFRESHVGDGNWTKNTGYSRSGDADSEYVCLEDLAPLAMDKIEALAIEGLRIQSGMSDGEAPANILAQSIGEISALEGKGANSMLGLEGAAAFQLLDVKNIDNEVDGLMDLSLTLDEWMRLDSGLVDENDVASERTTKVLAAHHAKSMDLISGDWNGERKTGKGPGKRWGLLGNNFTVALMVQLRDPMRDYEPVGTPMLALIQVERVFIPPKPKIYRTVSVREDSVENEEETEEKPESKLPLEKKEEDAPIPQFKISEVHIAGLKHEPSKKNAWGNQTQQSSGSRWLLATGMGKSNKLPPTKSKAVGKPSQSTATLQASDNLWSVSSGINGTGEKGKEVAASNAHVRNPNFVFPNLAFWRR